MLGIALKGLPRDSYRIMTKVTTITGVDPQAKLDELRKTSNTEYFDIMLLHWQHTPTGRGHHPLAGRRSIAAEDKKTS